MKRYLSFILVALCSSTLLLNCNCSKHLCTNAIPTLHFMNFDSADLHAVVVKSYNNDGKFDQLQGGQVYSNVVENGMDTVRFSDNKITLSFFTDYIVEIPSLNKTWRIRNITPQFVHSNISECTGGMTYYLNDTLKTAASVPAVANAPGYIDIVN